MIKLRVFLLATVAAIFSLAAFAGAANAACPLPAAPDATLTDAPQVFTGVFTADQKGSYVQLPFNVPANSTGMRIRYCYDDQGATPPTADAGTTLDMGVYQPLEGGDTQFGMKESRGWSGSAVKSLAIGENGFSDPATYNASRKAYVSGRTTRAFKPGPIPAGTWAVELGLGYLPSATDDPDGIGWTVEVTTTSNTGTWANDQYVPDNYAPNVANTNPGWYDGDLHAHGEEEPGNALMTQTFTKGFSPAPTGNDLDFMTLVDHNNNISRGELGHYQGSWPGKVIIPGTEETTYNGHFNSQGASELGDFRMGPIKEFTGDANTNNVVDAGELAPVRGAIDPSSTFSTIDNAGGWSQINHPTIFQTAPAACRGCFWNYSDAQTDYSKVDAIEVSTGTAVFPGNQDPMATTANPFLAGAIAFYERALATGNHIAAVASSDDHQGGTAVGVQDSQVGRGATSVYATELSQSAIIAGVKAGHTYAKPFGADAPDVTMTATSGTASAIPGDSLTGPSAAIAVNVKNAGAGATRPGTYTLEILKDGVSVSSTPINSDNFNYSYTATATGRYSFEVSRMPGTDKLVEDYSTPVWFTQKDDPAPPVSSAFKIVKTSVNAKKGTAAIRVKVTSPGSISSSGKGVAKSTAKVKKANSTVTLNVKATGAVKKALKKKHKAKVKLTITNKPTGGTAKSAKKSVTLKLKKKHKKKKH